MWYSKNYVSEGAKEIWLNVKLANWSEHFTSTAEPHIKKEVEFHLFSSARKKLDDMYNSKATKLK